MHLALRTTVYVNQNYLVCVTVPPVGVESGEGHLGGVEYLGNDCHQLFCSGRYVEPILRGCHEQKSPYYYD
jgi:hypothetical protein